MSFTVEGKEVIILGDMTTHGGRVISASATFTYLGMPVARVGDMVECPKCKGVFPIVEGAKSAFDQGNKIARHGDAVACGATLISRANIASFGTLYADAGNIVTDAGGIVTDSWDLSLYQTSGECDKAEFFALYNYFKKMADELDTDVDFIMAQAAEESGWAVSENAAKNNLFGQNKPKSQWKYDENTGRYYDTNVEYSSYGECCKAWIAKWGDHVRGAKTHDAYIDGLLNAGYNPNKEKYKQTMHQLYNSVTRRKEKCGVK